MNTKMIVRFYQTVKPHQPLIQFRHGVPEINKSKSTPSSPSAIGVVQTIEDYQIPTKFKRVMMEDAEINAINSGGAE
ncbi:uncharacterized protein LOC112603939 [Melanaphis sacchari]|uniref:uncharacterized protein LOC112603939 n=1 Tax=Melanaphis sacchari TaxID=742174 RepID=UPI000DC14AF4|nr:uncharacterized protein LOC112603939 [Melanaphis sacchari]XP_025208560.1 uncharacterized protein LOC112603939 [Melanaphis sacchari]XP_025208568.1 uncharacterized protein LOC112603939 [Melanaphis sacchari]